MRIVKLASIFKVAVRIGNHDYSVGDEISLRGKYGIVDSISESESGGVVGVDTDDGRVELKFDSVGFSANDSTASLTGVRKPKSASFSAYGNVTIKEGGSGYNLQNGVKTTYRVLSMSDDLQKMEVEYVDGPARGRRQVLNVADQARHMYREMRREMNDLGSQLRPDIIAGERESFALGYYAKWAKLEAGILEDDLDRFRKIYSHLTGDDLDPLIAEKGEGQGSEMAAVWIRPRETTSWTNSFKIVIPQPVPEIENIMGDKLDAFNEHQQSERHYGDHGFKMMDGHPGSDYVMNLLRIGFKLGRNHDVEKIRSSVSHPEFFDSGFSGQPVRKTDEE